MIPQEYIQEVARRNDIEELIGQYVHLRRRGRTLTGLCPFHNEKTPSFTVYPDTQSFYCFGCGAAGDAITFVPVCPCRRKTTRKAASAAVCWR